jgi:hypothetical protein
LKSIISDLPELDAKSAGSDTVRFESLPRTRARARFAKATLALARRLRAAAALRGADAARAHASMR